MEPVVFQQPDAPLWDGSPQSYNYLRGVQVASLQRLLRSLCRQALDAEDIVRVGHAQVLARLAELEDDQLSICAPLGEACPCTIPDPRTFVWQPVTAPDS